MKPALFIDFVGTMCHDRFWKSLGEDDYARVNGFLFDDGKLVNAWMRGDYSSEQICVILAKELNIVYPRLWDSLLGDCSSMRVAADDLGKIDKLREHYTMAIVTANMDCFDRFIVPALGLDKHFDFIVNSCNGGVFKHDGNGNESGLFEVALSKTGADINASILIDDSEKACAAFKKLGGRVLKVDKQKFLGYWLDDLLTKTI